MLTLPSVIITKGGGKRRVSIILLTPGILRGRGVAFCHYTLAQCLTSQETLYALQSSNVALPLQETSKMQNA
jgi:hypothetical protein